MALLTFTVTEEWNDTKLERFLKDAHGISGTTIKAARRNEGGLTIDGKHLRTIDPVYTGGIVGVDTGEEQAVYAYSEIKVEIIYEDYDVIIFNKPPHMPCHPTKGHPDDTVANVFAANPSTKGMVFRTLGRLDSNTSGLLAVAKHPHACYSMAGSLTKRYLAVVQGTLELGTQTVDAPIRRQQFGSPIRCVTPEGREAVTHLTALLSSERCSLAQLWLETGRTHQIRVHMAHLGHPLAGDDLYGGNRLIITRHALHCQAMTLPDGNTIFAPIPKDMRELLLTSFNEEELANALRICEEA